jgi:hypothetical protein
MIKCHQYETIPVDSASVAQALPELEWAKKGT